jgi:acyl-coenzyme A synthetase/AMP-(fatty) acid ligase
LATCCTAPLDRYPDRLAVASRHQERRLTWAELSAEADRVARGLWALGIRRGDRVGLWSTNCAEWIILHMGCARAGAALVNVNPAYRSHELQVHAHALAHEGALPVAQGQARRLRGDPGPRAPWAFDSRSSTPSISTRRSGLRCWTPKAACRIASP